jgi:hypothetical protein
MRFTKEEYHNMVDRWEAIGYKLIDEIATKEEAEEFLRLKLILKRYTSIWSFFKHPIKTLIAYNYTVRYARKLLR